MAQFKPKSSSLKAPNFKDNNTGLAQLMALMISQQKTGQAGQTAQDVANQFPDGPPPDTKLKAGDATFPLNPKRSVEEAQSMSGADVINNHIDKIKQAQGDPDKFRSAFQKATFKGLGKNKGQVMGMPLTYGDKDAIDLKFSLDDMSNRLLYLFSGKQINEQEMQRLSGTLPSFTDISDPSDNTFQSLNNKLDTYKLGLDGIKNRLIKGGNYDSKYWEGPMGSNPPSPSKSPIPGMPGNTSSQTPSQGTDIKTQYNQLRAQGMSAEDAKKKLGL